MIQHQLDIREKTLKLTFPGDLLSSNVTEADTDTKKILEEQQSADWNTLILDLSSAKMVDSAGLNLIVSIIKYAKNRGSEVKSIMSSRTVYRTTLFTRLDKQMVVELIDNISQTSKN